MARAIDYAYGYKTGLAKRFSAAHVVTVMRYVGDPSNSKCLGRTEAHELRAAGIGVGFVYEAGTSWMLAGKAAGVAAAQKARDHIRSIGGPNDPFVYFAADWDVLVAQEGSVLNCLRGAATVLGTGKVGIYGGRAIVTIGLSSKAAAKAWQATAWSGGRWNAHACLRQFYGANLYGALGLDYDANEQLSDNVGQWGYVMPKPKPKPKPPVDTYDYTAMKVELVKWADFHHKPHVGVDTTIKTKGVPFEKLIHEVEVF
jgi:hypothetical protein